jgi:hypothetical protein
MGGSYEVQERPRAARQEQKERADGGIEGYGRNTTSWNLRLYECSHDVSMQIKMQAHSNAWCIMASGSRGTAKASAPRHHHDVPLGICR